MKNKEQWKPTKAVQHNGNWRGSRDVKELGVGSRAMADWLIAVYEPAIAQHATGILADIGCGKMPYYGIYCDKVSDVIGVDWPSSLHDNQHIDVYCDLNDGVQLDDACVDTVLCTDVMEHIFEIRRLWSEIFRILKPSGKAIISVPFHYWIHEAPHDYHRYTKFALERYAEEAGFEIVSIETIGGFLHVLTDMLCKATARVPTVGKALIWAVNALLKVPKIRRLSDKSCNMFTLAYVVVVSKSCHAGAARLKQ